MEHTIGARGLMARWLDEVWLGESEEAVARLMHPQASIYGLEEVDISGPQEFAAFFRLIIHQFSDFRYAVLREVCEGDWISGLYRLDCRRRSNGRKASVRCSFTARFENGLLVEGYNLIDYITLFEQVGLLPPRTLDTCLTGRQPVFQRPPRLH